MIIEANRSETEGWRISRLKRALEAFCRVYGISNEQADLLIERIHDHKGNLSVMWVGGQKPTPEQVRAWAIAWEICGEPCENIDHNRMF
jgi:hypothetical protein